MNPVLLFSSNLSGLQLPVMQEVVEERAKEDQTKPDSESELDR